MNLDVIPAEIGFCEQLETIDLTGNPIDSLPDTFSECRRLSQLKINYQTFCNILDNYMLTLLDENKIHSVHIPHVIFELEHLDVLDLSRTKMNFIPNEQRLVHLTELYLANNLFVDMPTSICTMKQLKILDMSFNRLKTLPKTFEQMLCLERMILTSNKLSTLSTSLTNLSTLKYLIVNHNQIETIDENISCNRSLLLLDLSYNRLTYFPHDLCQLEQLETLDIRYNRITHLPLTIVHMTGLRSMHSFVDNCRRVGLHLFGNQIVDPPSFIWKSTDIQTLFRYCRDKQRQLSANFIHMKIILLGPKHTGKTTFALKLIHNRRIVSSKRTTLDIYEFLLRREQPTASNENNNNDRHCPSNVDESNRLISSPDAEFWTENLTSSIADDGQQSTSKIKRLYRPTLNTYRTDENNDYVLHKFTLITENNLYCTIIDLTSEVTFEVLHPLIYDCNALFILPVNLTVLIRTLQSSDNTNE
jgi:hypothetical protein